MRTRIKKYKIGQLCGERIIVGYKKQWVTVRCSLCGRETSAAFAQLKDKVCFCQKKFKQNPIRQRYSGRTEEKTEAELLKIKNKYKNGIPKGEVEKWIINL